MDDINKMWNDFKGLVYSRAIKISEQYPAIDRDDLIGEASVAFMKAIQSYEAMKGAAFSTYLYVVVTRTLSDYIARELSKGMCSASTKRRLWDSGEDFTFVDNGNQMLANLYEQNQ